MEWYNLGVVFVSLMPLSPAVLLADLQWTSSDEHTCFPHEDDVTVCSSAGSLRGTCPASAQTSNWHSETQISSLELSPSCHHVARWRRKAWYLETRGFILKKIQWHIHAGPWSLVNWWHEALTRHYIGLLMNINEAAVGPYGMASALMVIGVSAWYPDNQHNVKTLPSLAVGNETNGHSGPGTISPTTQLYMELNIYMFTEVKTLVKSFFIFQVTCLMIKWLGKSSSTTQTIHGVRYMFTKGTHSQKVKTLAWWWCMLIKRQNPSTVRYMFTDGLMVKSEPRCEQRKLKTKTNISISLILVRQIFTACEQSLRRLCFFTPVCPLCSQGGEYLGQVSPGSEAGTPPGQVHHPAGTTPGRYTLQAVYTTPKQVHSLHMYTPPSRLHPLPGQVTLPGQETPPPWQVHHPPDRYTTSLGKYPTPQCMLGDTGNKRAVTHPTGMQFCIFEFSFSGFYGSSWLSSE